MAVCVHGKLMSGTKAAMYWPQLAAWSSTSRGPVPWNPVFVYHSMSAPCVRAANAVRVVAEAGSERCCVVL